MSVYCVSCQCPDGQLHRSTHLQLLFCNAECRDEYICKTHRYPPHVTDEQYVVVPVRSDVAEAYRRWPVLLETGKSSLEHCRHPDAAKNAYVLQRHIVEPIATFIQQIGPKRKAEAKKERPKRGGGEATSLTSAATALPGSTYTPLLSAPPPLPAPPATTKPLQLIELPPEVLYLILNRLRAKDWARLFQTNVALRDYLASDPAAFAKALSTMSVRDVYDAADSFIRETDEKDYALGIMDGFARRFATVIGGEEQIGSLCHLAVWHKKSRMFRVLLALDADRGMAIIDLRKPMRFSSDTLGTILVVPDMLDAVVEWRIGDHGGRAVTTYIELLDMLYKLTIENQQFGLSRSFSEAPVALIVELILQYSSPYRWIKALLLHSDLSLDSNRSFSDKLRVALFQRADVNAAVIQLAERKKLGRLSLLALNILNKWRGPRSEYVDFARAVTTLAASQRRVTRELVGFQSLFPSLRGSVPFSHPYDEGVDIQKLVRFLAFYLRWTSPDGSSFIDLRNRDTLALITFSLMWHTSLPGGYGIEVFIEDSAPVMYDYIMKWRVPAPLLQRADERQNLSLTDIVSLFSLPTGWFYIADNDVIALVSALATRLAAKPHGEETLTSEADVMFICTELIKKAYPLNWGVFNLKQGYAAVLGCLGAPLTIKTERGAYRSLMEWLTRDRGITLFETGLRMLSPAVDTWFSDRASFLDYCALVLRDLARNHHEIESKYITALSVNISIPYPAHAVGITISARYELEYAIILAREANKIRVARGDAPLDDTFTMMDMRSLG